MIPGKVKEQLILETVSRHVKDKKVIRSSQHGFTMGKSWLTNLLSFCHEMTGFRKAVDTVFHKSLVEKLLKYGLDEQ